MATVFQPLQPAVARNVSAQSNTGGTGSNGGGGGGGGKRRKRRKGGRRSRT